MKILHTLPNLDPSAGGLASVAIRLASAQAGLGHDVAIACYHDPSADQRIAADAARVPHFGRVQVEHVAALTPWECRLGLRARRRIDAIVRRFDIVHNHGVWDTLARIVTAAARKHDIPYVIAPHGMLDPWSMSQKWLKKRVALALGYRAMLDAAAFIHALNHDEQQLMAPLRLKSPVQIIPNGVYLEEFQPLPLPGEFRGKHPELGDRPYVLFLGRLHPKKGLDYLAEAFAKVLCDGCDAALVVAGPDDGALGSFLEQCRRLGIADRIVLTGLIWGREKLAALVDAACFCLPSRQEGFSMAIAEALACQVPVVISQACHFPEVAQAGAGFVLPLETKALAEALLHLLCDPSGARAMGRRGRELVRQQYAWPAIARRAIDAYAQCLASDGFAS